MNDRYLFKAKRKNWQELPKEEWWVRGLLFKMCNVLHITEIDNEHISYPIDEETLCQCTGLKDKHKNLIWENDVIKCQDAIGKIGWNETHLAYTILTNVNGNMQYYYIDEPLGEEIKVIGNIFDNPELLEVE